MKPSTKAILKHLARESISNWQIRTDRGLADSKRASYFKSSTNSRNSVRFRSDTAQNVIPEAVQ